MRPEDHRAKQPLFPGTDVVLREAIFEYDAGTRGVVVRNFGELAHVQFETTKHTVAVPQELLADPRVPGEATAD